MFEAIAEIADEGTPDIVIQNICTSYKEAFVAHRTQSGFVEQLYEGALESITSLAEDNWLLAIATGKSRRGLDAIFKTHDLEKFFDTIWCADDGPGKPSPFMCLEAMSALGAETSSIRDDWGRGARYAYGTQRGHHSAWGDVGLWVGA